MKNAYFWTFTKGLLLGYSLWWSCVAFAEDGETDSNNITQLVHSIEARVMRLDIYYSNWYSTRPNVTFESITAEADSRTTIFNPDSAIGLLRGLNGYVRNCDEHEVALDSINLRIDLVGSSSSFLGSFLSDGNVLAYRDSSRSNSTTVFGCITHVFRYLFSLGNPGYYTEDDSIHMLIEELTSMAEQSG